MCRVTSYTYTASMRMVIKRMVITSGIPVFLSDQKNLE